LSFRCNQYVGITSNDATERNVYSEVGNGNNYIYTLIGITFRYVWTFALREYPAILVEHLDDYGWWRVADAGDCAVDNDSVEDEHLVPGRTECLLDHMGALALVKEHDASERIRQARFVGANKTASLIHMCT